MSEQKQPCPKEAYIIGYFGGEEIDKQHKVWVDFTVLVDLLYGFEQSIKSKPKEPETVLQLSDEDKDALKVSLVTKDDIVFKRTKLESLDFTRSSARVEVWICKSDGDHSFTITKDQAKILAAWLNLSSE